MSTVKGTDGAVFHASARASNLLSYPACNSTKFPYITGDGDSSTGVTVARSTEQAYREGYSQKITLAQTSGGEARFCDSSSKDDLHGLSADKTYKLSGYIYVPSTGGCQAAEVEIVVAYTTVSTGAWHEATASPTSPYDSWRPVSTTAHALTAGAVGAVVMVRVTSNATTGEYFYIDNVKLTTDTTGDAKEEIAGIDSWELTAGADNDETTDYIGGREKKYIQTTVHWTGSMSGSYATTGPMQTIVDQFSSTDSSGPADVDLELYADETTDDVFIGNFKINSIANTGSVGTKRSFSADIQSNGGVRHTTYSST